MSNTNLGNALFIGGTNDGRRMDVEMLPVLRLPALKKPANPDTPSERVYVDSNTGVQLEVYWLHHLRFGAESVFVYLIEGMTPLQMWQTLCASHENPRAVYCKRGY